MPFDSIIGHEVPIRILRTMLAAGQVPHAFIFSGAEGIGKRTTAFGLFKALNCQGEEADFCDKCSSCSKIQRLVHPDLIYIEPEKNVIRIEQIRALQQETAFRSVQGGWKAVIIDQADKLNLHAANCLLKTLEEPPEATVLMLIVQSTAGMLPTVLSRCQRINFSPLRQQQIAQFLSERGVEAARADFLAQHAQGSIQRAFFLEQSDFFSRRNEIAEMLAAHSAANFETAINLAERLSKDSAVITLMLEFLEAWYRDLLLLKDGVADALLYNRDIIESLHTAATRETHESIVEKLKKIQWIQKNALLNIDLQLGLENVFMQQ